MEIGGLIRILLIQPVSDPLPEPLPDEGSLPTLAEPHDEPVPLER